MAIGSIGRDHCGYQLGLRFSLKLAMPSRASSDCAGRAACVGPESPRRAARRALHLGLEFADRAGRAVQQRIGDSRASLEFFGAADFMRQADAQSLGGGDALAGQAIAAEAAVSHGADQERRDAERRHADAHLGNGKECAVGREHDIAAGRDRRAAADRRAMHHRDRRLGQAGRARRGYRPARNASAAGSGSAPRAARSAPAQKCLPLPRSTTTRVHRRRRAPQLARQFIHHLLARSALLRSGRLSTIVAIPRGETRRERLQCHDPHHRPTLSGTVLRHLSATAAAADESLPASGNWP